MNGEEIYRIALRHYHTMNYFGGVYASDTIPKLHSSFPIFYIVNTDLMGGEGKHWILLFITSKSSVKEWIDPLAHPPSYYNNFLNDYMTSGAKKPYLANINPLQSNLSEKCGYFCLTIADLRCSGYSLDRILRLFYKSNLSKNDDLVTEYVSKHMI